VTDDWDVEAAAYDDAPDHGLADPDVRAAWRDLLRGVLPAAPARVVDLGCGTGTLARLLVDAGHAVDGLDASPEMLRRARAKVPEARFTLGDASTPPYAAGTHDVVLCRHVLWALPDPPAAYAAWARLLVPGGVAVLVEGHWGAGAGLTAAQTEAVVRTVHDDVTVRPLPEAVYWGREIDDERYVVVGRS